MTPDPARRLLDSLRDTKEKELLVDVAFWRSEAMYEAERKRFWQRAWLATAVCGILSGIMSIGIILSNG